MPQVEDHGWITEPQLSVTVDRVPPDLFATAGTHCSANNARKNIAHVTGLSFLTCVTSLALCSVRPWLWGRKALLAPHGTASDCQRYGYTVSLVLPFRVTRAGRSPVIPKENYWTHHTHRAGPSSFSDTLYPVMMTDTYVRPQGSPRNVSVTIENLRRLTVTILSWLNVRQSIVSTCVVNHIIRCTQHR
jgi:hypothetical protein